MTILESPYQRLIDIIDIILVKNKTMQRERVFFSVVEVPSLPQNGLGAKILADTLKKFQDKGVLPAFSVSGTIHLPKLNEIAEKRLLAERQALFEQARGLEPRGEISLNDHKVAFDDDKATIMVGAFKCPLPPFKNEHFFCRAMFQYPANEPVDWSLVYKEISGSHEEVASPKKMRPVQDTMYALNNRIKEVLNTPDTLFTWENKSIKRNF